LTKGLRINREKSPEKREQLDYFITHGAEAFARRLAQDDTQREDVTDDDHRQRQPTKP
jgi:hypothetical protein